VADGGHRGDPDRPVTLQIVSRYTALIPSWIWTEELSRFLFIWMIMLGAMIGVREGSHFVVRRGCRISAARERVPADRHQPARPRVRAGLRVVGIEFVRFGWDQSSELAELPMTFIFIAWPVAGVTWVLFLGEAFIASFRVLAGKNER